MTSADALKAAAERIDKYHDEMLWNGMPLWMAQQIEDARAKAHQRLADEAFRKALA